MTNNIRSSQILIHAIKQLATDAPSSQAGGGGRRDNSEVPASGHSDSSFDDEAMDNEGEGEISALAKRILELSEGGDKSATTGAGSAGDAPHFNPSVNGETTTGGGHDDLRASVQRAFSGQQ